MSRVTNTSNRLHFDDLNPLRFENLILDLLWSSRRWESVNSVGQSGGDEGVDILAVELTESGKVQWHVQCKRYAKFSPSDVDGVFDPLTRNFSRHDALLVAVSCDVSRSTLQRVKNRAKLLGYRTVLVWDRSALEAMLYNDKPRILGKYFGIEGAAESEERRIQAKIELKASLKSRLLAPFDPAKPLIGTHRFQYSSIILKAINEGDGSFRKNEFGHINDFGWYSIKKTEPYNIHEDGLSLIFGLKTVYFNDDFWSFTEQAELSDNLTAMEIGELTYENIRAVDYDTDDFRPAFFCYFDGPLGPFSEVDYELVDGNSADRFRPFPGARRHFP